MKIDLIFPPIEGADALAPTLSNGENLGLGYLAASLREHQHDVRIINSQVSNLSVEEITTLVVKARPEIVGLSPVSASFENTRLIIGAIRNELPKAIIVLGGHLASLAAPEIITELTSADVVLAGDAESSLVELAAGRDLREIPRAYWLDEKGAVQKSQIRAQPADLDEISFPARDDLGKIFTKDSRRSARILASRGCQYDCSFCTTPSFYGRNPRFRSPSLVIREMQGLYQNHSIEHLWFNDDLFVTGTNKNTLWIEQFCSELKRAQIPMTFRILCRADSFRTANFHIVDLLKSVGLTHVFLSLESGSDEDLKIFNKHATAKQNRDVISLLRGAQIKTQIGFIMFNPYSKLDDVRQNANFLATVGELFRFFPLTRSMEVFFGTPIYHRLVRDGLFSSDRAHIFKTKPKYQHSEVAILSAIMERMYVTYSDLDNRLLKLHRGSDSHLTGLELLTSEQQFTSINLEFFNHLCDLVNDGKKEEYEVTVDAWILKLSSALMGKLT